MKISILRREFSFSRLGLSVYVLLLALLLTLGFWQLSRVEQKKQYLLQQEQKAQLAPMDLNNSRVSNAEAYQYQKALAAGRYDDMHQFLVDNQVMDGKPGYFVLTPFLIDNDNRAVLVNRGWVALGADRKKLPDLAIRQKAQSISGRINHFPPVGIKLAGAEIPTEGWPAVVQVVDARVLAQRLAYDIYDFQIELDAEAAEGYLRAWKAGSIITPEKHLAYAVQWFGLALTLTGLFLWFSSRKSSEYTTQ